MNLFDPPELRSERLVLAPFRASDGRLVRRLYEDDPRVTRFVGWKPPADAAAARRFAEREARAWREEDPCRGWIARRAGSGHGIGALIARRHDGSAEFSYVVRRAQWNRGFATEMVRALLDRAGKDRSLRRVWAVCDAENAASRRVLEKAGMAFDGILAGHQRHNVSPDPRDCVRFALDLGGREGRRDP